MRRTLVMVLLLALIAACSDDTRVDAGNGDENGDADQRYEASGTVLESTAHGPQLCLGGVMDSLPPQCGGPDIVGWDWDAVAGEESANGSTWGEYRVVGTYTDGVFTLTEAAGPPDPSLGDDGFGSIDFAAPCPAPAGGWAVVDPATATATAQEAALAYAASQPDHAGSWVDQSINPALVDGIGPGQEELANDPARLILVVLFTGDLERHTDELRAVWGGALCVASADRTSTELEAIQTAVSEEPGFLSSGQDVVANQVVLHVILAGDVQARLDDRHGDGAVRVTGALHPIG